MELRNLTHNPTDYLDAYCDAVVGHTNWAFSHSVIDIKLVGNNSNYHSAIIIFKNPEEADAKMDAPEE